MALYISFHLSIISPKYATAKMPTFSHLNLRTPSLILHPRCGTLSLSSIFTLHANPPRKFVYPDPIPEFSDAETQKFKVELRETLLKDGDALAMENEVDQVVNVCAKILHEFLSKDYGGPGTLLVEPFTYMLIALKDNNLPAAPLATRASLLRAQNHIDCYWQAWNSTSNDQVNIPP